jgi:hypothetical protein
MAKSARIKDFSVEQYLKTKGIEIQVDDGNSQFGDIYIAKTGITWCDGQTSRKNGTKFSFDELSIISNYKEEAMEAARKAKNNKEAL